MELYHVLARPAGLFRTVGRTSASDSYALVRFRLLVECSECRLRVGRIGVTYRGFWPWYLRFPPGGASVSLSGSVAASEPWFESPLSMNWNAPVSIGLYTPGKDAYEWFLRWMWVIWVFESSDLLLKLTDLCILRHPRLASFGRLDPGLDLCSLGHDGGSRLRVLGTGPRLGGHGCGEVK